MAQDLGYDPDIYKTFGDNLALAEYYKIKEGIGSLRSKLDVKWHSGVDISTSKAHKHLVDADFPIIYTTNYDKWIENAFKFYNKNHSTIINVKDISNIKDSSTQIVKFHGDFTEDDSLVLDETSYFARLEFESPLDIKFRSDILGKSVLFIGYSLSDVNIRFLFYKLSKLWKDCNSSNSQPVSYIFTTRYNPIQKEILKQWGIKMLYPERADPKEALEHFLELFTTIKSR